MGQSRSSLRSHGSTSGASRNGFSTQVAASMLRNVFRSVYVGVQLDAVQVGCGSSFIKKIHHKTEFRKEKILLFIKSS